MFRPIVGPIYTRNEWVKQPGHEFNHSHKYNVEIKNKWSYSSAPPYMYSWSGKEKLPLFLQLGVAVMLL
jgi:nicotinamide mononucleotide adenylyltransferase